MYCPFANYHILYLIIQQIWKNFRRMSSEMRTKLTRIFIISFSKSFFGFPYASLSLLSLIFLTYHHPHLPHFGLRSHCTVPTLFCPFPHWRLMLLTTYIKITIIKILLYAFLIHLIHYTINGTIIFPVIILHHIN